MAFPLVRVGDVMVHPTTLRVKQMAATLFDRTWAKQFPDREVYALYFSCESPSMKEGLAEAGITQDLLVLPGGQLGKEYIKTLGYRVQESVSGVSLPELYEVLGGRVNAFLQHLVDERAVDFFFRMDAVPGDKILVPGGYSVTFVNAGSDVVHLARVRSVHARTSSSFLFPYRGMAYYLTFGGMKRNPRYRKVVPVQAISSYEEPRLKISTEYPLVKLLTNPAYLRFLVYPEKFSWMADVVRMEVTS